MNGNYVNALKETYQSMAHFSLEKVYKAQNGSGCVALLFL